MSFLVGTGRPGRGRTQPPVLVPIVAATLIFAIAVVGLSCEQPSTSHPSGLGISRSQVIEALESEVKFERAEEVDGSENYVGTSNDRLAVVQLIGPPEDLRELSIAFAISPSARSRLFQNPILFTHCMRVVFPEHNAVFEWFPETVRKLTASNSEDEIEGHFDGKIVRVGRSRSLGLLTIRVRPEGPKSEREKSAAPLARESGATLDEVPKNVGTPVTGLSPEERQYGEAALQYIRVLSRLDVKLARLAGRVASGESALNSFRQAVKHAQAEESKALDRLADTAGTPPPAFTEFDLKARDCVRMHRQSYELILASWEDGDQMSLSVGVQGLALAASATTECIDALNIAVQACALD